MNILFILNDPPYGTEKCYNALRLAIALVNADPEIQLTVFLMADAVAATRRGQKTPDGYYNLERMIKRVAKGNGHVLLCGTCMDARGLEIEEMLDGAPRSTMDELAEATLAADEECGAIARAHGIPFHTDAAQSVGKIPVNVDDLGVDLLTIAGHKLYAPKGVGALYVRNGVKLEPLIHGAGHEQGRRAGTESALLATALGQACVRARDPAPMKKVNILRDRFWTMLKSLFGDRVVLNGHAEHRLPNTLNISFVGRIGAEILAAMPMRWDRRSIVRLPQRTQRLGHEG